MRHLANSWTLLFIMVFGCFLLMVASRPELQPRTNHPNAPAHEIELAGQLLTWSTASVLAYRMTRGARGYSHPRRS